MIAFPLALLTLLWLLFLGVAIYGAFSSHNDNSNEP